MLLLQASLTTAHTLLVGAVCGVMLGTALWHGAPSLVAGDTLFPGPCGQQP